MNHQWTFSNHYIRVLMKPSVCMKTAKDLFTQDAVCSECAQEIYGDGESIT